VTIMDAVGPRLLLSGRCGRVLEFGRLHGKLAQVASKPTGSNSSASCPTAR
jgi:hypothetical protein